jgi:lipid A ethanolaminephosphotransferase
MPWAIAPDEQTHVPFVLWLSPALRRTLGVDPVCLAARARQPASHDNLFHSLLGIFDVQTQVYDRELDLLAPCRGRAAAVATAAGTTR